MVTHTLLVLVVVVVAAEQQERLLRLFSSSSSVAPVLPFPTGYRLAGALLPSSGHT